MAGPPPALGALVVAVGRVEANERRCDWDGTAAQGAHGERETSRRSLAQQPIRPEPAGSCVQPSLRSPRQGRPSQWRRSATHKGSGARACARQRFRAALQAATRMLWSIRTAARRPSTVSISLPPPACLRGSQGACACACASSRARERVRVHVRPSWAGVHSSIQVCASVRECACVMGRPRGAGSFRGSRGGLVARRRQDGLAQPGGHQKATSR
jgi:hypothetical protein